MRCKLIILNTLNWTLMIWILNEKPFLDNLGILFNPLEVYNNEVRLKIGNHNSSQFS
jgi:hypothetical protein